MKIKSAYQISKIKNYLTRALPVRAIFLRTRLPYTRPTMFFFHSFRSSVCTGPTPTGHRTFTNLPVSPFTIDYEKCYKL